MKRILFIIAIAISTCSFAQTTTSADSKNEHSQLSTLNAQLPIIGCLSYDAALRFMPQYRVLEAEMDSLRQAYGNELKRVEEDFNQKYEAFLEGRKDFPRTILLKRQTELQQLLQRNVEFKEKSRQELEQIHKDKLTPLHARLSMAISNVARRHQLAVVVNTDSNACPFIDPSMAIDLNEEVKEELSKTEN